MTVYARQLAFAASEVAAEIDKSKSRLEQFAWLGIKAFTGAISMLFLCRGGREEQFVAQVCYQKAYRERFGKYGDCPDCWGPWPKSQTTLGQYHRTGSSAMDVAAKFTEGMFAEIEHARLKAYPNQAIDGYELGDLANWPKVFWSELNLTRPELADWPLWSVHQERDRIVAAITEEFELARAKANDIETLRMVVDSGRAVPGDREHLSDDGILQLTPRLLHGFFRRWKSRPAEGELERFNGKYLNRSALPAFQGEIDGLLTCLFKTLALAGSRRIDVPGLRRFCEALRHYDIPAADSLKYDAMADMARLRVAVREPVGDGPGDRDEIASAALGAVVAGGLAGVMQAATTGTRSVDRVTAVIRERVGNDPSLRWWPADRWVAELKVTKKTITDSDGWKEILAWREANKADRVSKKTAK